ncbi:transposase (plasmid) [Aeromonas salmonicida subsp. masoucida]|nr:transposase [Aeromonas salmonicida subsp. masoucida]
MKKSRRTFTPEFKLQAASLVIDQHYSIPEACMSMEISETCLRKWVRQIQSEREGIAPKGNAITEDRRRIQELEARVKRLEMEKDILKKATALLMSDSIHPSHK